MLYPTKDMANVNEKLDVALKRIRDTGVHYAKENRVYQSQLDLDQGEGDSSSGKDNADSDSGRDNDEGLGNSDGSIGMGMDWSSNSDREFSASDIDDHLDKFIFISPS